MSKQRIPAIVTIDWLRNDCAEGVKNREDPEVLNYGEVVTCLQVDNDEQELPQRVNLEDLVEVYNDIWYTEESAYHRV